MAADPVSAALPGVAPAPEEAQPAPAPVSGEVSIEPLPLDTTSPQLTWRALGTGMVIGGALSLCNIYSGLKIGWGFNMSITAALLGFGFWQGSRGLFGTKPFGLLENNINQTAASSAAAISSAGLVAPIPALTMITGQTLGWAPLALWCFSVCLVGITVAVALRRQMLVVDKLPFASGIASAQTLKEMYARGRDAMVRVQTLIGAALFATTLKILEVVLKLPKIGLPGAVALRSGAGPERATLYNLGFAFEPSVLMVGVGALIGFRAGVSLLLGAVIAWGILGPWIITQGWAEAGGPGALWYGSLLKWLLWPGVALMVTSSLTSFAFSWKSIANAFRGGEKKESTEDTGEMSRSWFLGALAVALVLSVVCQVWMFGINWFIAVVGVMLTFILAVVAARVSGETSVTPVGAMGKVTQLVFGAVAPGNPAANLMSANVTGGAASQCADLLHDMKAGYLLGAKARLQAIAQFLGALAGALAGSAAYLVLIPDPQNQLLTEEWPAPAVAAWKSVAELFQVGFDAMPAGAVGAMIIAGIAGVVLAVVEKTAPPNVRKWVPSPASIGLAFVIPAYNAISMFVGGAIALALMHRFRSWSMKFIVIIAAGLIAGESLTGVGIALQKMIWP